MYTFERAYIYILYILYVGKDNQLQGVPRNMTVTRQLEGRFYSLKQFLPFIRKPYFEVKVNNRKYS